MRILKTFPHLDDEELKAILKKQKDARNYQDWQIILSVQLNTGRPAEDFANILGVNIHKIYRIIEIYNKEGPDWNKDKHWGGRRDERAYITFEEEKELLEDLKQKALNGQIITVSDIKLVVEKRIGHHVSDDYLWDLLKRHDWQKKAPRPKHPKGDPKAQEEFKKNSPKIWLPPH
ncbi:hypothetical protein ES705_33967 [subsurface metagenome]